MAYRKLGRDSAHRKAMLREMTTQLIMNKVRLIQGVDHIQILI